MQLVNRAYKRGNKFRRQRGGVLLWVLAFGVIVGIAALTLPRLLKRAVSTAFDSERQFEAQLLAANIKEVAKYLILYEKVFYTGATGGVLGGAGDPLAIDADIRKVWSQSFTEMDDANSDLVKACGGYSLAATYVGTHKLGASDKPVFCPFYFRTHLLSGAMNEQLLFERWAAGANAVVTRPTNQAGNYLLTLNFTPSLAAANGKILALDTGMKIIREGKIARAEAFITFSTDSGGFRAVASERYVNITSRVTFYGERLAAGNTRFVEDSETIMMTLSTPREFALFMLYPPNPATPAVGDRNFSQNALLPASTNVYGRTFFNGNIDLGPDIDAGLDALPTFYDAVVLTGNLQPIPGPQFMNKLQAHFRKGLVTNFSASRYLYSGTCAAGEAAGATATYVQNLSGLQCSIPVQGVSAACEYPDLITTYLHPLNPDCWSGDLTISAGGINYTYPIPDADPSDCPNNPAAQDDCIYPDPNISPPTIGDTTAVTGVWNPAGPNNKPGTLVHGGFKGVTVNNQSAFISSPVRQLTVRFAGANIYGLVFGGAIDASAGGVNFYSLAAIKAGLTDIGTSAQVAQLNSKAAEAYEGVAVPLLNMPVVYSSREGIK